MKKICVLGSGSWGTALAAMLNKCGHEVSLWSRRQDAVDRIITDRENKQYLPGVVLDEDIFVTCDMEKALEGAKIIISAVPSKAVRETAAKYSKMLTGGIIVNVAKGIEQDSLLRLSEVIINEAPQCSVCMLSGPSHAEEVGKYLPTACVIASADEVAAKTIQNEFMNPYFRVYTNSDIAGVEYGAAFKNIIALAAGMSDGLGFGDNAKAALLTRGVVEIARLGVALGGKGDTFMGLSGIGDIIVTCTSMHSRNRRAGILLGKGYSLDDTLKEVKMVVEGVNTAKSAYQLAQKHGVSMPIVEEIYRVLFENKDARAAVIDLMMRKGKAENINTM